MMARQLHSLILLICLGMALLLVACQEEQVKSPQMTQDLKIPERLSPIYMTDQVNIAGQVLSIWLNTGRCQLQAKHPKLKVEPIWLKSKAPCYFVKSPGTDSVQVYQRDKTNRVLAVIGTPSQETAVGKRCGTEIEGVVIDAAGKMRVSNVMRSGTVFCADQGLDNAQYELFARD